MAAHKHAEVIKAWADGAEVQFRNDCSVIWKDVVGEPIWDAENEYRIKPAEPEREPYPETRMSKQEMERVYAEVYDYATQDFEMSIGTFEKLILFVNAALRHACDAGQIVTRAEFGRGIGDRAARDMAVAEAVMLECHGCVNPSSVVAQRINGMDLGQIIKSVK